MCLIICPLLFVYIYRKNQPILEIFVTADSVRDLLSDYYNIRTIFQLWIDYHAKKWKFVFHRNPIPILIKQVTSNISLFQQEMMFAHYCWSTGNQIQCKQLLDKANISAEMPLKQCWLLDLTFTEWIVSQNYNYTQLLTISRINVCRA